MAPLESVGNTTWDMNTFQDWLLWLLGSTCLSDPYQTASARPAPPALIQGKMLVASPVLVRPSLTWTCVVHLDQPLVALEALTKTWRSAGSLLPTAHATTRLRPESIDSTENRVSGDADVSAIWTRRLRSWLPPPPSSRKSSVPVA